jgi:hypothetical protein
VVVVVVVLAVVVATTVVAVVVVVDVVADVTLLDPPAELHPAIDSSPAARSSTFRIRATYRATMELTSVRHRSERDVCRVLAPALRTER